MTILDWNFFAYCFRVLNKRFFWEIVDIFAAMTIYADDNETLKTDWWNWWFESITLRKTGIG